MFTTLRVVLPGFLLPLLQPCPPCFLCQASSTPNRPWTSSDNPSSPPYPLQSSFCSHAPLQMCTLLMKAESFISKNKSCFPSTQNEPWCQVGQSRALDISFQPTLYLTDSVLLIFLSANHVYRVFLASPHYLGKLSQSVIGLPLQLEFHHYGPLLSLAWLHSGFLSSFNWELLLRHRTLLYDRTPNHITTSQDPKQIHHPQKAKRISHVLWIYHFF